MPVYRLMSDVRKPSLLERGPALGSVRMLSSRPLCHPSNPGQPREDGLYYHCHSHPPFSTDRTPALRGRRGQLTCPPAAGSSGHWEGQPWLGPRCVTGSCATLPGVLEPWGKSHYHLLTASCRRGGAEPVSFELLGSTPLLPNKLHSHGKATNSTARKTNGKEQSGMLSSP